MLKVLEVVLFNETLKKGFGLKNYAASSYQLTWPITSKKSGVDARLPHLVSMNFISFSGKISIMVLEASLCMELFLW